MKILAHLQENVNAIHYSCVLIHSTAACSVYQRSFVEVNIDIVLQIHLEFLVELLHEVKLTNVYHW